MSEKRFNRIEDAEIKAQGVQSLPIRPNASSQYGQGGLSGKQLQARFDRLAGYIIKKYNELVDGLASHDVLDYFKLPEGYSLGSLYELVEKISDSYGDLIVKSPYTEKSAKVETIIAKLKEEIDICKRSIEGITFEGLPDRPFGGTPPLNLTYTTSKGSVAMSDGGGLYLQTDATYTVDELIGATASVSANGNIYSYTLSRSDLKDESPDGIVFKVDYSYIYVVYSVEYTPTSGGVPTPSGVFPSVGIYFYRDAYGDLYTSSLVTQGNIKPLDNAYIDLKNHPDYSPPTEATKLYKHNVYINSGQIGGWTDEAKIYLSYVSTSATPITTLAELINSPAVAVSKSGSYTYYYLQYAYATYHYVDAGDGDRDVERIMLTDKKITICYITAYTVPIAISSTTHEHGKNYRSIVITDTVTEV